MTCRFGFFFRAITISHHNVLEFEQQHKTQSFGWLPSEPSYVSGSY
jgi:hypothetical protein